MGKPKKDKAANSPDGVPRLQVPAKSLSDEDFLAELTGSNGPSNPALRDGLCAQAEQKIAVLKGLLERVLEEMDDIEEHGEFCSITLEERHEEADTGVLPESCDCWLVMLRDIRLELHPDLEEFPRADPGVSIGGTESVRVAPEIVQQVAQAERQRIIRLISEETEYPTLWPDKMLEQYKQLIISGETTVQEFARAAVAETKEALVERIQALED